MILLRIDKPDVIPLSSKSGRRSAFSKLSQISEPRDDRLLKTPNGFDEYFCSVHYIVCLRHTTKAPRAAFHCVVLSDAIQ